MFQLKVHICDDSVQSDLLHKTYYNLAFSFSAPLSLFERIALPARLTLSLPSFWLIHQPMLTISSKSGLPATEYGDVCSAYSTSSVATLPVAPGEYGQPPRPPTEESMVRIP